ncbi:NUDIX domain-containing protein [Oceanobacillus massiliensis]|uniref:NUDIX domain-containing protein n=1 Tax=Oceanobacillus massiliensis TaxID=1465765 RepID=UPI0030188643
MRGENTRNRASVLIIEGNQIAVIKRIREGNTYYVFPGGGMEDDETPEAAAIREAYEELGLVVNIDTCLIKLEDNGTQYYFLAAAASGTIGTGTGEGYTDLERNRGEYLPMWVEIEKLIFLDIKPREVAVKISLLFE